MTGVQTCALPIYAGPKLPEYTSKYATGFPVGALPHRIATSFLQASVMQPLMMPQIAIIDRMGMIREQYGGNDPWHNSQEKNLRASIAKYLAEPAGGARKAPAKKK